MSIPKTFRERVLEGLSWTTAQTIVTQAVNVATFVVLGKFFLDPSDFGLVAMISVFTGFASIFTEFGLGAALVNKQDLDDIHKSSIFWLSILMGTLTSVVFCSLRGVICDFYTEPDLNLMIVFLALTFVIGAAGSVHISLLRRELRFQVIAIASIVANIVSSIFAVVMAANGAGPWALIWKAISMGLILTVGVWLGQVWRPKFKFSLSAISEIFNFSVSYFGAKVFTYSATKLDELMTGKFVGDVGLGLYSNAFKIVLAPLGLIKNQVVGVFFPALSSIQEDKERVRRITLKLSGSLAMVGFPVLIFIAVSAKDWILIFLDDKWLDMELMLILLSMVSIFEISIFPGVLFLSQGRADGYFKLMLCTKSLSSVGVILGVLTYGTTGLLVGLLVAAICNFLPYLYFSGRLIGLTVKEQLAVNYWPFLIAVFAAAIVVAGVMPLELGPLQSVILKTLVFFPAVGICYLLLKPYPLQDFFALYSRSKLTDLG